MPPAKKATPPTWQDSEGRDWCIKLNLGLIDDVLVETKIDLAPADNDLSEVVGLLFDDRALAGLLWSCCKDQAENKGIDRKQFNQGLDAEALKSGWGAVVDAIHFFTQIKSPKLADAQREAFEAQMKFVDATATQLMESIRKRTSGAKMKTMLSKLGSQIEKNLDQALDKSASNWPVS
jgi:hypothetical protein